MSRPTGPRRRVAQTVGRGAQFLRNPLASRRRTEQTHIARRAGGAQLAQIRHIGRQMMAHHDGGVARMKVDHRTQRSRFGEDDARCRGTAAHPRRRGDDRSRRRATPRREPRSPRAGHPGPLRRSADAARGQDTARRRASARRRDHGPTRASGLGERLLGRRAQGGRQRSGAVGAQRQLASIRAPRPVPSARPLAHTAPRGGQARPRSVRRHSPARAGRASRLRIRRRCRTKCRRARACRIRPRDASPLSITCLCMKLQIRFQTAAAEQTQVAAVGHDQHARAGLAVGRAGRRDHGGEHPLHRLRRRPLEQ